MSEDTINKVEVKQAVTVPDVTEEAGDPKEIPKKEDDLDDLDDLLDDFADDVLSKPPGSTVEESSVKENIKTEPSINDHQASINELIKDLKIEDPETQQQFEELVKQFETNHREEVEKEERKPGNFEYVMKETMERLKKSGESVDEKIKNDPLGSNPEDLLTQLLSGMGGGEGDMDMSKLLVDMLDQLSSKEVLFEPIKDLNNKFPKYLQDNKDKLPEEKYQNYNKQYELTNDILNIFENPTYSDSNKPQREKINALLESLQELGQPPTELVGESGDFLPGLGGGKNDSFGFNDKDLPADFEKNLQEGCPQQ